eukprot:TRINITY_DN11555_c0_g1_i1.p1 TRINITY_DN11555_c0_g1~~TRINITY_DN11555_c0_g1_i1.p1  ORF type:complete len:233 (-),score=65.16 TRINITY_DN11555_c0_g1_i1:240-938(-)
MRRPNSTSSFRDESVSAKWNDIKDWEKNINQHKSYNSSTTTADMGSNGYNSYENDLPPPSAVASNNGYMAVNGGAAKIPVDPPKSNLTAKEKFIQFKKQSTRRFVNIKNTISGKYKRAEESRDDDIQSEVSTSPAGNNTDRSQHSLPTSCGPPIKSFGNMGRGIKASKSLQNLEQITKDSWRQVADRTTYLGQNIKHKCSSKVDINKLAPKMNYESLNCEDSDEENRPTNLF